MDAEVSCDTERKKCSFAHLATFAVELVWYFSTAEFAEFAEDSAVTAGDSTNAMRLIACGIHRQCARLAGPPLRPLRPLRFNMIKKRRHYFSLCAS